MTETNDGPGHGSVTEGAVEGATGGPGKDVGKGVTDVAAEGARAGAAGGAAADPEAVSRFVEGFASQLVAAGMLRMPARVFAALLASEEGVLTAAELGSQLQVSPAAVSGAIRYLDGVTLVSREREPGSRRERYRVSRDQWYEVFTDRQGMLRRWEQTLSEGIATMGPDTKPGRRIAETLEFFRFVQTELNSVVDRWRKHRYEVFGDD